MSWKIDPTHTQIEFTVKHMMIAKVRGRFETFEGSVELDPKNPTAARVEGTIEVTSLVAVTAPLRNYFYRPNGRHRLQEISLNRHISPSS